MKTARYIYNIISLNLNRVKICIQNAKQYAICIRSARNLSSAPTECTRQQMHEFIFVKQTNFQSKIQTNFGTEVSHGLLLYRSKLIGCRFPGVQRPISKSRQPPVSQIREGTTVILYRKASINVKLCVKSGDKYKHKMGYSRQSYYTAELTSTDS